MSAAAAPVVNTNVLGSATKAHIGYGNMEIQDVALISGNVSCVATAAGLSKVDYAIWIGPNLTAVTTYSGNTATFAFTDPVATVKGTVILFGK